MKDELVIRTMKGFIALRRKMYTYLTDYGHVDKKAKGTKKCVIKRNIKFQDYKDYLENKKIFNSQQRFRSELHNIFTEKVIKIVLRMNDDERIQTRSGIISYPYGIDQEIVYKEELIKI